MGLNRAIFGRICSYMENYIGDYIIGRLCGDFHGLHTRKLVTSAPRLFF